MRRGVAAVALTAVVMASAGCGGGQDGRDTGDKQFLLIVKNPLVGRLANQPDAELLDLGHQICARLDANARPDVVVDAFSHHAEPGSAEFNTYSYVVAAAAIHLCPEHKDDFKGSIPTE